MSADKYSSNVAGSLAPSSAAAPSIVVGPNSAASSFQPKTIYLRDQSFKEAFPFKAYDIKDWPKEPNADQFVLPTPNENFSVHHGIWQKLVAAIAIKPGSATPAATATATDSKAISYRNQALKSLCNLLKRPNAVMHSIHHSFIPILMSCVVVPQPPETRLLGTIALTSIAQHRKGRQSILSEPAHSSKCLTLLSDEDIQVRYQSYLVWKFLLTSDHNGVDTMVTIGGVERLIEKADEEENEQIKTSALNVLAQTLTHENAFSAALAAGIVLMLTRLLRESQNSSVLASACKCLALTAVPLNGKKYCVIAGAIPLVINQLVDTNAEVREQAAHTLMNLSIDLTAKEESLKYNAIPVLLSLIDRPEESDILRSFCLHALAHIAEKDHKSSPIADAATRQRMEQLTTSKEALVRAGAECVIEVLNKL